ncbi:uncharacterized protein LACBIDRAFT_308116 [Laccaria bicolor S238N-H82]|uniref:Predicted protein n=1 Tax=Laccaria bicolor (strain S238N-H82 / ATCC MYA-4686) TaxID=486041 RepID=B0DRP3_LACBS|nr:uncharacterized protein LACBIDRAFT_308116 [Laccaria bicolor S238N-H82]EDR02823.1 predicted protein [Laccaria bicolor S238N-H82]|eukprot:XP_001886533.1 predicted protein [Laccaria bicolor S238N-H82]
MSLAVTFNESLSLSRSRSSSSSSHNVVHSQTPIPTTTNSTDTSSASSSSNVPSSSYITVTVTDHDTPLISSTYVPNPPSSNGTDTGVIVSAVLTVVMVGGLLLVAFIFVRRARKKAMSQKEDLQMAYPAKPVWEPQTWRREVYATMSDKSTVSRSPSYASTGLGHYKKSRIQTQPVRERTDVFS